MHDISIGDQAVENLFSAPLLQIRWSGAADLNERLAQLILSKSSQIASTRQSNKGGWQSPRDLQRWDDRSVARLLTMVDEGTRRMTIACIGDTSPELEGKWKIAAWANINTFSNYNGLHNHSGGFWSGVYYVSAGVPRDETSQEGHISFRNPTLAPLTISNLNPPPVIGQIFKTNRTVKPCDGMMLLFPSWLEHYVHPYFGREPRISISWDAMF